MPSRPVTLVYDDADELRDAAADRIAAIGERALSARGRFRWVMTGGSTARFMDTAQFYGGWQR